MALNTNSNLRNISLLAITYHIAKLSDGRDTQTAVVRGRQQRYKGMSTNTRGGGRVDPWSVVSPVGAVTQ